MARVWILLLSLSIVGLMKQLVLVEADLPAIYIFGDSTVDVGTNPHLSESLAQANMSFNGIDYPFSNATGRFSNGYNTADLIVRLLDKTHSRSPPPFLSLLESMTYFKRDLTRGANFASGGSGILDSTGNATYRKVVPLGEQIQQFSTVRPNITIILGPDKADKLISNSLYLISVGGNDFFDYQRYNSTTMLPETFMTILLNAYATHLEDLYTLGARKFAIIGVPPIGCCPAERVVNLKLNGSDGCFEQMNDLARSFYNATETLLNSFTSQFQGVKYSLGNAFDLTMTIINNPLVFGIKDVKTACCGNGTLNGEGQCTPLANLCPNREEYLFWDFVHPTQAVSWLAALTLYGGAQQFVTPMNFSQLAPIDI
ncbi:GDSL esterase/lipase At4g28780-like [Camellia sinensis]|uniref:GDSL esterase/lipase At4g28780-like n=1 Tax=Camellia sinensis TaxID=4442 RepID=UPI0010360D8B|nr:GDSL esterase/lipase At4g28780-like [Camellia sinensis]